MLNPLAVSVVIPMFNAEKYLGECLESILHQTFQNFEVIVVDDCSTDSSCAIVESYIPKFDGRLKLSHMEKNSGSGALPRNKGLALSRGEYIFFADADDMLTPTALEELYTLAKKFDADVVYCEKHYELSSDGKEIKAGEDFERLDEFVDKPTLDSENLSDRIPTISRAKYWVTPWCKLVRRDLMIEHEIFFPHCKISEDSIWTYGLVFYAKRFLRVPNVVYIYRSNEESVGKRERTPEQNLIFWFNPLILSMKYLDDLMSKLEFFQENPYYRYSMLENLISNNILIAFCKGSYQMQPFAIYETIKKEFGSYFGENAVSISALFAYAINLQKVNSMNAVKLQQISLQVKELLDQIKAQYDKKT